jgi:hypothetical protein
MGLQPSYNEYNVYNEYNEYNECREYRVYLGVAVARGDEESATAVDRHGGVETGGGRGACEVEGDSGVAVLEGDDQRGGALHGGELPRPPAQQHAARLGRARVRVRARVRARARARARARVRGRARARARVRGRARARVRVRARARARVIRVSSMRLASAWPFSTAACSAVAPLPRSVFLAE